MKKTDNRRSFTLKGLLVIVVIIALLAAVVLPICSARLEKRRAGEGNSRREHAASQASRPPEEMMKAGEGREGTDTGTESHSLQFLYGEDGEILSVRTVPES